MSQTPQARTDRLLAPRLAGAALLAATGAIHLDLYLTGYRHIPTIGVLFLLQIIAAFVLAAAVLAVRSPLADLAGAGFAIATLGGYLLTVWIGLFGFQEVRTTAGLVAGLVEVAAFGVLAYAGLTGLAGSGLGGSGLGGISRLWSGLPGGAASAVAALSAVALIVLGVSLGTASGGGTGTSTAAPGGAGSGAVVKVVIKNFAFIPANPDVQPGERIEVTNDDAITHTLTAGPSSKDNNLFNTGSLGPHQSKIIAAPRQRGMYPFYCTFHHFMTGMLIVGK
jgi:plastocyanin